VPDADRRVCSSVSAASGEPLWATASRYRFWLLLEQTGPWGHDALVESGLPGDVGRALREAGARLGIRVLLIKRRDRGPGPRRCYLAYTGSRERRVRSIEVDDPAEVLRLDLADLARGRFRGVGTAVDEPLYLVCTHGKHDPCCARHGGPLFRAVEHVATAWECTHVGGDRFAGNLVCFPHGLYFGRVPAEAAPGVVAAYADGRVALEHYRGRSAFSPPVQAAEREVRMRLGIEGVDDLELRSHRRLPGRRHRVEFAGPGGDRHQVDVRVFDLPPRPLTCKAVHPGEPRGFEVSMDGRAGTVGP
jgi:hypothetical protein